MSYFLSLPTAHLHLIGKNLQLSSNQALTCSQWHVRFVLCAAGIWSIWFLLIQQESWPLGHSSENFPKNFLPAFAKDSLKTMNAWYKWDKGHFNYPRIPDTVNTVPLSPATQKLIKSLQKQALLCSLVGSTNLYKLSLGYITIGTKIENDHFIWPKNCMFKCSLQENY